MYGVLGDRPLFLIASIDNRNMWSPNTSDATSSYTCFIISRNLFHFPSSIMDPFSAPISLCILHPTDMVTIARMPGRPVHCGHPTLLLSGLRTQVSTAAGSTVAFRHPLGLHDHPLFRPRPVHSQAPRERRAGMGRPSALARRDLVERVFHVRVVKSLAPMEYPNGLP